MAIDMAQLGDRLVTELLSGSEGMSSAQLVNKLVDDKLQDNGIARDERKLNFVDKVQAKISDSMVDDGQGGLKSNLDSETLAGYRRLITKYST